MGRGHPECPQRLDAINDHLIAVGLADALDHREAPLATLAQLERAHTASHVRELQALAEPLAASGEHHALDPDTSAGPGTWGAALRAAGAAVAATDAVLDGEVVNAFCAVRPPGHHATRDQAMGFCFFNNVAVAARHALDVHGLERVAIIDFDVHHGNGTEDVVAGDDRVLMAELLPASAVSLQRRGAQGHQHGQRADPTLCAWPTEVREAIEAMWLPRLEEFKPQMIFISAGFDAHREDDLGQLGLVEADYAWITRRMVEVAARHAQGRIVSCLEGRLQPECPCAQRGRAPARARRPR